MKNNLLLLLSLCTVALLSIHVDCYKRGDTGYTVGDRYAFKIPVNITPVKRTYSLNDTIWLEAEITGKALFDTLSGRNITLDTSYMQSTVIYYVQMAATTTNPINGHCQITDPITNIVIRSLGNGSASAALFHYGCGQSTFRWKFGFKPNYKGTYAISIDRNGSMVFCNSVRDFYTASYAFQFKAPTLNRDLYDALPDSMRRRDSYSTPFFTEGFAKSTLFMIKVE